MAKLLDCACLFWRFLVRCTGSLITKFRTRSINLTMEAPALRIAGIAFLCVAALASVVLFTIGSSKRDLAESVSAIPGPSVDNVSAGGKIDNVIGGAALSDKKRRVSVFMWELDGGFSKHRGATIHVEDKSRGAELVRIQIH